MATQEDSDERDDEVLLLQLEDCEYANPDNQSFDILLRPAFQQDAEVLDLDSRKEKAAELSSENSRAFHPVSFRQPPAHIEWPRSDGYSVDVKNFETSDSDDEPADNSEVKIFFATTASEQKSLAVGDECLCLDSRDGQQWLATIKKKTEQHALVHYKGWSKSCDDWVSLSSISPKPPQAVLERIKFYNACTKNFNSNARNDPRLHLVSASSTDDQQEILHTDYRGVEPVYNNRSRKNVVGWNAVSWEEGTKHVLAGSPFESSTEAAKAWDHASSSHSNFDPATINFLPQAQFVRNPKIPLGSRVILSRKGAQDGGAVTAFFGKGRYQISCDGGDFVTVSIPSSIVSVVSRPQAKSAESRSALFGPSGAMLKLQAVCEKYPSKHIIGSLGITVGGIRALWRRCRRSGVLLQQTAIHSRNPLGILKPLCHTLLALSSLRSVPAPLVRFAEDSSQIKSNTASTNSDVISVQAGDMGMNTNNFPHEFPTVPNKLEENRKRKVLFKDSTVRLSESRGRLQGNSILPSKCVESVEPGTSRTSNIRTLQNDLSRQYSGSLPTCDAVQGLDGVADDEGNENQTKQDISGLAGSCLAISRKVDFNVPCEETLCALSRETDFGNQDFECSELRAVAEFKLQQMEGNTVGLTGLPCHDKIDTLEQVNKVEDDIAKQETGIISVSDTGITSDITIDAGIVETSDKMLVSFSKISRKFGDSSGGDSSGVQECCHEQCVSPDSIGPAESRDILLGSKCDMDRDSSEPYCLSSKDEGRVECPAIIVKTAIKNDDVPSLYRRNLVRQAALVSRKIAERPKTEDNTGESPQRRKRKHGPDRSTQSVLCEESQKNSNTSERVEVNSKGTWWIAMVQQKAHGQVKVRYLDSDGRYTTSCEWVREDRIRPLQAHTSADCGIDLQNLIGVTACQGKESLGFWNATYSHGIKKVKLGTFTSLVEAVEAYDLEALRHNCGNKVRLNRPHMRAHYLDFLQEEKRGNKAIGFEAAASESQISCTTDPSSCRQLHRSAKRRPIESGTESDSNIQLDRSSDCRSAKTLGKRGKLSKAGMRHDAPAAGRRSRSAKRQKSMVDGSCLLEPRPKIRNVNSAVRKAECLNSKSLPRTASRRESKAGWRKDDTPETVSSETIKDCRRLLDGDGGLELRHAYEPETQNLLGYVSAVDLSAAVTSSGGSPDHATAAANESPFPLDILICKEHLDPNHQMDSIANMPQLYCTSEILPKEHRPERIGHDIDCSRHLINLAEPCSPEYVARQLAERPKEREIRGNPEDNVNSYADLVDAHQLESDLRSTSVLWQEDHSSQHAKPEFIPSH